MEGETQDCETQDTRLVAAPLLIGVPNSWALEEDLLGDVLLGVWEILGGSWVLGVDNCWNPLFSEESRYFSLAKGRLVPSLPLPCQESLEKLRHGKPLPNASKSLVRAKYSVGVRVNDTCFRARAASASAGSVKLPWFPPLTSRMSKRTCPSIDNEESVTTTPPFANRTAFTQPDPNRETRTGETAEGMKKTTCSNQIRKHATCY